MAAAAAENRAGSRRRLPTSLDPGTGIIAQEMRNVLPHAVKETGNIKCENGETIENFLMVDKDQIFMENVGAVKQLCKLTNNLEMRIEELEIWNQKLAKLKRISSLKQTANERPSSRVENTKRYSKVSRAPLQKIPLTVKVKKIPTKQQQCSRRIFQATVIALISVMILCAMTISTLYILYVQEEAIEKEPLLQNNFTSAASSLIPPVYTTMIVSRETSTTTSMPVGATEINFCDLLPCNQEYCCSIQPPRLRDINYEAAQTVEKKLATPTAEHSVHPANVKKATGTGNTSKGLTEIRRIDKPGFSSDWIDTTISSIQIVENQQVIDHHYCKKNLQCGSGVYSYIIPVSKYTPTNMRITLEMNTTEPLIVYQCKVILGNICNRRVHVRKKRDDSPEATQGLQHHWILPVAYLFDSEYHFRVATPDLANCSTDPNFAGILYTDYHFYFHRDCN